MKPNSKEFQELQQVWYDKLCAEGFYDIERFDAEKQIFSDFIAKRDYFRMCGMYLESTKFPNYKEQAVWSSHTRGLSLSQIRKELGDVFKVNKTEIREILKKHRQVLMRRRSA